MTSPQIALFLLLKFVSLSEPIQAPEHTGVVGIANDSVIGAPVHYSDAIVVLSDDKGIAVIRFTCPAEIEHNVTATSDVIEYRFRYRRKNEAESFGQGILYENYKTVDHSIENLGSKIMLHAGHFKLEWSQGSKKLGWLYYMPEKQHMQFAAKRRFDDLNLDLYSHRFGQPPR